MSADRKTHFDRIRPNPDSVWRCPCGYEDTLYKFMGHRKGYKLRPECHGKSTVIYKGIPSTPPGVGETPNPPDDLSLSTSLAPAPAPLPGSASPKPSEEAQGAESPPDSANFYEWRGDDGLSDSEMVARRLVEARAGQAPLAGPSGDGEGVDSHGAPPLGEFSLAAPEGEPQSSMAREQVSLPVSVRVMYDWAREQGWLQGDGSLSAFVTDIVLDHFWNCWGLAIVVIDREEILNVGQRA